MRLVVFAIIALAIYFAIKDTNKDDSSAQVYTATLSEDMQSLVHEGKLNLESIRSALRREHRTNTFRGNTAYPQSLSSNDHNLFDKVLITPLTSGSSLGWKSLGEESYQYTYGKEVDDSVIFQYDNQNGMMTCVSYAGQCRLFE